MKIRKIFTSLLCVIFSTVLMSGITAFASVINGNPTSYTGHVNGTYVYSGLNAGNTVTHKAISAPDQYIGYYKKAVYAEYGDNNGSSYTIFFDSVEGTNSIIHTDSTRIVSNACKDRVRVSSIYKSASAYSGVEEMKSSTVRLQT